MRRRLKRDSVGISFGDDDLMNIYHASDYLMWSTKYTRLLIKHDLIPYTKIRRQYFLKKKDLDEFVNNCRKMSETEQHMMSDFLKMRNKRMQRKSNKWHHITWIEYLVWRRIWYEELEKAILAGRFEYVWDKSKGEPSEDDVILQ